MAILQFPLNALFDFSNHQFVHKKLEDSLFEISKIQALLLFLYFC